ncbi:trypsin-like peptidase domain-containing protein [Actinomadura sp. DC4]|uniref:trypsin-like serine peptidase n=1 Tax=Actinomadura sp. DC4 TaxID=3055069 RepID=UPI0025B13CF1|nr:trypsin-like peptidase domain-containing protein [Actinomadura sp. DC4]MDN3356561.1 trypsin-like peptidase domain-containing protein [Actinomadura sp. DC4]
MFKSAPFALVVPAVSAALAAAGPATSHPAPGVTGVVDNVIATASSATLRYWTAERMRRAVIPPPRHRPNAMADTAAPAAGAPVVIPGSAPARATRHRSVETPGAPWTSRGAVRATTGKVFFTIDGGDYVCSAGTVSSANHDLVVTAGHCAQDATGKWARNWIYVPGYDQGRRPYGAFAARHMFVPGTWSARGDENFDVALVALATSAGRHVADVVGAQGIAFDQPRGGLVYGFGYPAGGHYDGERLTYCSGRTSPDSHKITKDEGLRCDMTEGSSGGPWLTRFDAATGTGVVTSVSSFKYADDPATMYGPYFGPAVRHIYDRAQQA